MQMSPRDIPLSIPGLPKGKNTYPTPFGIRLVPRSSPLSPSYEARATVSPSPAPPPYLASPGAEPHPTAIPRRRQTSSRLAPTPAPSRCRSTRGAASSCTAAMRSASSSVRGVELFLQVPERGLRRMADTGGGRRTRAGDGGKGRRGWHRALERNAGGRCATRAATWGRTRTAATRREDAAGGGLGSQAGGEGRTRRRRHRQGCSSRRNGWSG